MDFLDHLQQHGPSRRLYGVYTAIVVDIVHPEQRPRVKVSFPWLAEWERDGFTIWARLSTPMAGGGRGIWHVPEVGEEVLVAFSAGDSNQPIVIGSLWNGVDEPPEQMDQSGDNNIRSLTSRSGHKLEFDDSDGSGTVTLTTTNGNRLILDDVADEITVEHHGGATITMDGSGNIAIEATAEVSVNAPSGMSVDASQVTVTAGMSSFSGVVQCDTLITNSVISASYTPGAGNVW